MTSVNVNGVHISLLLGEMYRRRFETLFGNFSLLLVENERLKDCANEFHRELRAERLHSQALTEEKEKLKAQLDYPHIDETEEMPACSVNTWMESEMEEMTEYFAEIKNKFVLLYERISEMEKQIEATNCREERKSLRIEVQKMEDFCGSIKESIDTMLQEKCERIDKEFFIEENKADAELPANKNSMNESESSSEDHTENGSAKIQADAGEISTDKLAEAENAILSKISLEQKKKKKEKTGWLGRSRSSHALEEPHLVEISSENGVYGFNIYENQNSDKKLDDYSSLIYVSKVSKGSPAARAKLRVGDRILAINGERVLGATCEKAREIVKRNSEKLILRVISCDKKQLKRDLLA